MKFLLQQNLMNEDQLLKVKQATENHPREFISLIPFSREIVCDNDITGTDYLPYGSTLLTTLGLDYKWKGLFFDLDLFNYGAFKENRDDMLNDWVILPVKDAIGFFAQRHGEEFFLRPSHDLKQFTGTVMEASEAEEWLNDAMLCDSSGSYQIDADMPIVIDVPKNIQAEWRWFIVDGMVVSGSMYRFRGNLQLEEETDPLVIIEAQMLADKWLPNPTCVMDVALVDDEVKIIEFNCINSSGFYANDVEAVFNALAKL